MNMRRIERDKPERVISLAEYLGEDHAPQLARRLPEKKMPRVIWALRVLGMLLVILALSVLVSLWSEGWIGGSND